MPIKEFTMERDWERERDRGFAESPTNGKKVTWKEPIEQHVSYF